MQLSERPKKQLKFLSLTYSCVRGWRNSWRSYLWHGAVWEAEETVEELIFAPYSFNLYSAQSVQKCEHADRRCHTHIFCPLFIFSYFKCNFLQEAFLFFLHLPRYTTNLERKNRHQGLERYLTEPSEVRRGTWPRQGSEAVCSTLLRMSELMLCATVFCACEWYTIRRWYLAWKRHTIVFSAFLFFLLTGVLISP